VAPPSFTDAEKHVLAMRTGSCRQYFLTPPRRDDCA
jgi:hypothetical protein